MTPASTFEKFLTSVFYTSIIGVSSFLLVFYLVDLAFVSLLNSNLDSIRTAQEAVLNVRPIVMPAKDMFSEIFSDKMYLRNFSYNLISPFAVTSIFLLGSIYFKRFHYIKTATTLILFLVLWVSTSLYVMKLVTDDTVWIGNQYWQNENHVMQVFALIAFTVTIVFSVITYIRLKEKEV
ncbi:MAG: hypothetical protein EOO93_27720 [Pedobacter sp.]|nr:MAG: hypothetical protein EOO93_27720 [Pedobacter sp.]